MIKTLMSTTSIPSALYRRHNSLPEQTQDKNQWETSFLQYNFPHTMFLSTSSSWSSDALPIDFCPQPQDNGYQESDLVHSIHLCKMNTKFPCQELVLGFTSRLYRQFNSSVHQCHPELYESLSLITPLSKAALFSVRLQSFLKCLMPGEGLLWGRKVNLNFSWTFMCFIHWVTLMNIPLEPSRKSHTFI